MRVHLNGDASAGEFAKLLLEIGNGKVPETNGEIEVTDEMGQIVHSLENLLASVYPNVSKLSQQSQTWLCERAILTPTNNTAAIINDNILRQFPGEERTYESVDSVLNEDNVVHYSVEFLNSLNPSGMPPHKLTLKTGAPIMLLRNLNAPKLCNGTRLQVRSLKPYAIEANILTGCAKGQCVFIPRIPLIPSDYPFEITRLQFPVKPCFAMTINKAQGQSLRIAGIDLRDPCFSHGQFYVA